TDSSQKPEPVIEEPKKLSSVYDRLYANSKPKVRKRIEENPKKVEKPKKKPVKKERSFNVDHKLYLSLPGLHVENEKEAKPRVSVYDRLYKTTTESRRAQQKVTLPQPVAGIIVHSAFERLSESDSDLDDSDTIDFTKFKRNRPKTARDLQRIIVKRVKKQGAFRRLHKVPAPLIEQSYETLTKDEPHKLSIAPIVTITIEEPDKEFTQTNENI
ncbi:hypothetical protein QYM36_018974, partial [Artemia franciscana]